MLLQDLFDDINIVGDRLGFDYNARDGVSTRMGKKDFQPYVRRDKTLDGYSVYSVYSSQDENLTDVLLALKKKSYIKMDPADYAQFIRRTAIYITAKILGPNKTEVVVTPRSSTNILNDLLAELKARNPHIDFLPESYVKTADISKIEVDYSHPAITPAIAKTLEGIVRAAQRTGKFEIKKALPQNRKFFRNFFEVVDPALTKRFINKNVCVFDDVLSSGTTVVQIMKDIGVYGPSAIYGCVIFKTR